MTSVAWIRYEVYPFSTFLPALTQPSIPAGMMNTFL
jgi:hypothetical protein